MNEFLQSPPTGETELPNSQDSLVVSPSKPSILIPILLIVTLFLTVGLTFLGYQYLQLQDKVSQMNLPATNSEVVSPIPMERENSIDKINPPATAPSVTWETYQDRDKNFIIKYPAAWNLKDESKMVDLYQDGKQQFQANITISNGDYTFSSINPLAWGPDVCLYPDSPGFEGPAQKFSVYEEFETSSKVYRRSKVNQPNPQLPTRTTWVVCSKNSNEELFSSVSGFGQATYTTPQDASSDTLKTLDEIFKSLRVKE